MESPRDIQKQITSKLTEDGLDPVSTDVEKLLFLWKLYQQLKDDLEKSQQKEAKLKEAQAKEMKEVESYVEHIRQLSDDREALIQELETENEALKLKMAQSQQENSQSEIVEMLSEQGLAEIAKSSPEEQIAYLLVERTRLIQEVEKSRSNEGQRMDQILEQERAEFEQTLNEQREKEKMFREQLKQEHEEEINALIEENGKLEEDLQNAEMRLSQLKAEVSRYTEADEEGKVGGEESRALEETRVQLEREKEEIEREMAEIESDRADFQIEKDRLEREKKDLEKEKLTLQKEMAKLKQIQEEMDMERDELDEEKEALEEEKKKVKLQLEERDKLETLQNSEKENLASETDETDSTKVKAARMGSPARSSNDMMLRKVIEDKTKIEGELVKLKAQMKSMQNEKNNHDEVVNNLKKELEKSVSQHQILQMKNKSLNTELESLETQLDELEIAVKTLSQEKVALSLKNDSLMSEVKTLRADSSKSSTLQDIVDILSNDKQRLNETLETFKIKYEQTANDNEKLTKEEQYLTNQLQGIMLELDHVTKEKEQLSSREQELLNKTKQQVEVEKQLRENLEALNQSKETLAQQTDILTKENKELLNLLDKTKMEADAVKLQGQEIDKQKLIIAHIKDQNENLQNQLKSLQGDLDKSRERETAFNKDKSLLQIRLEDTEERLKKAAEELTQAKCSCEQLELKRKDLENSLNESKDLLKDHSQLKDKLAQELEEKNRMKKEYNNLELRLTEKLRFVELFETEKQQKQELEAKLEDMKHELEVERKKSSELERSTQSLQSTLALQMNKEELVACEGKLQEERQLNSKLTAEGQELRDKVNYLETSQTTLQELLNREQEVRQSLEKHVEELKLSASENATKTTASSTLKAALDELDRERQARTESDFKLQQLEELLDEQKSTSESIRHSNNEKINSLKKTVQTLEDDLFTLQDEYQALQDKFHMVQKELEISTMAATEKATKVCNLAASKSELFSSDKDSEKSDLVPVSSLNEALNEVNSVKTKLNESQEQMKLASIENEHIKQHLCSVKELLDESNKQLENSESNVRTLRKELIETQGSLELMESQLKNKQAKVDSLLKDRDDLEKEADSLRANQQDKINKTLTQFETERKSLMDKISILEKLAQKLELDNREMALKLTEVSAKNNREKVLSSSSSKLHQDRGYTEQLEHDIDTANKHIIQLRENLHQHQTKVLKIESDNLGLVAKHESMKIHMEQNIQDLKQKHRQEVDILQERCSLSESDARELTQRNKKVEEDMKILASELSKFKSNAEKLDLHLLAERKLNLELETRNAVIDEELSKAYSQIRSLMEKNAELESIKHSYELDITKQKTSIQQAEGSILQKEITYKESTKAIVARAEAAERRAREVQRELEEVTQKMLHVERVLSQAEMDRGYVDNTKDKILLIRNQLEGEKLQRTFLDQTVTELKHQVAFLKQREIKLNLENKELHQTILDLEADLNQLQSKFAHDLDTKATESSPYSLMDQIARLQREVTELQYELSNVSEKRDVDMKRYEQRKLRTKSKLIKAREFYTNERSKYMDQMQALDSDLRLTRAMLEKELEWRDKMDESYKKLLREKRGLITQLSEVEESLRDKSRALTMAQTRIEYLEEENANLIDLLNAEKQNMNILKKEMTAAQTDPSSIGVVCGFGASVDSEWDSYNHIDPIEPPVNFRKFDPNRSMSPGPGNIQFIPPTEFNFKRYSQVDEFKLSPDDFYDEGDEFEA